VKLVIERKRGPKKRWLDIIESNMRAAGVCVGDVEDQCRLRRRVTFILVERNSKNKISIFKLYLLTKNKMKHFFQIFFRFIINLVLTIGILNLLI